MSHVRHRTGMRPEIVIRASGAEAGRVGPKRAEVAGHERRVDAPSPAVLRPSPPRRHAALGLANVSTRL